MTTPQPYNPGPTLEDMQRRYHETAALANSAMSALLEACSKLDRDTRNAIVQAAIRYSDAETTRHNMAKHVQAFKVAKGIQ